MDFALKVNNFFFFYIIFSGSTVSIFILKRHKSGPKTILRYILYNPQKTVIISLFGHKNTGQIKKSLMTKKGFEVLNLKLRDVVKEVSLRYVLTAI